MTNKKGERMTNKKFKELLKEHSENEQKIQDVAAPLYARRNELVKQLLPEFLKRKAPDVAGLLTAPLTVKFRSGQSWTLQPNYVSASGDFKGAVFKNYGVELFTIRERKVN